MTSWQRQKPQGWRGAQWLPGVRGRGRDNIREFEEVLYAHFGGGYKNLNMCIPTKPILLHANLKKLKKNLYQKGKHTENKGKQLST